MRRVLAVLLLFLFTLIACAANPKDRIHASLLEFDTRSGLWPLTRQAGDCSGYAVGPHSMLTAGHCVFGNADPSKVSISFGKSAPEVITEIILDGHDHALVVFTSKTFSTYVAMTFAIPEQSDRVFMWGNPTSLDALDCWREGYFSGHGLYNSGGAAHPFYLFIMPSAHGDSGSLIFNGNGDIVGMANQGDGSFTISEVFSFTEAQLARAK
jgi:hypothetical protein